MKTILLNIVFFSAIFAQSDLKIMGGLNQSKQTIEEDAKTKNTTLSLSLLYHLK